MYAVQQVSWVYLYKFPSHLLKMFPSKRYYEEIKLLFPKFINLFSCIFLIITNIVNLNILRKFSAL